MKEKFMKNGVFSLEYDKETLRDMVLELQDKYNNILKEKIELKRQLKEKSEVIDKINNYIDNYDIFKVFSFPLMKRWEEEQVKSSIDYEFKTSLIKDLKEILEDKEE